MLMSAATRHRGKFQNRNCLKRSQAVLQAAAESSAHQEADLWSVAFSELHSLTKEGQENETHPSLRHSHDYLSCFLSPCLFVCITNECISSWHTDAHSPVQKATHTDSTGFNRVRKEKHIWASPQTWITAALFNVCKTVVLSVKHGELQRGGGLELYSTPMIHCDVTPDFVIKFSHTADPNIIRSKHSLLRTLGCPGLFTRECELVSVCTSVRYGELVWSPVKQFSPATPAGPLLIY